MRTRITMPIIMIICILLCAIAAHCNVIYVRTDGNDLNDGSSWALAKRTIQAGLNASLDGDEVWVKAGTYNECITFNTNVDIYGGFAGTEITRTDRNWNANKTTLYGSGSADVVTATNSDIQSATIDGFTIRNGNTGCGIFCAYSSLTVSNNTITGNIDSGIICAYSPSSVIAGNTITSNGGMGVYFHSSTLIISNNIITENAMGGIQSFYYSSNNITATIINNNTISNNDGVGIYCYSTFTTISNNKIAGNTASGNGGGIYCNGSSVSILNNKITGNYSNLNGSGIFSYYASSVISNNIVAGNTAGINGGGIYFNAGSPVVSNNTIVDNTALGTGGIYFKSVTAAVSNNIIAYNSSGIDAVNEILPTLHNNCVYSNVAFNYNGLLAGTGDISVDPGFVSHERKEYHIRPDSPCRDAGWNDAPNIGTNDIDGNSRILPVNGNIDIGADEFDGTIWRAAPTVIRVDSVNGNDYNEGSSWSLAKKTVQSAIDMETVFGNEVWVKAGTYNEKITLKKDSYLYGGFAGNETVRSARNWTTNKTILNSDKTYNVVNVKDIGYMPVAIDGFTIQNGGGVMGGGGINCSSSSPIIVNNTITNNNSCGIACNNSSPVISNNIIIANTRVGISCTGSSSPTISNNTITSNNIYGISCTASYPTISNNIVAFQTKGINVSSGYPMLTYNDFYNPGGVDYVGTSAGGGDISSDPMFVDPQNGDYHLRSGSPCIEAGDNASVNIGSTDYDGKLRIYPFGGKVDMGCYEYGTVSNVIQKMTQAKTLTERLTIELQNKPITAAFSDAFYIEESDRVCGLRVISTEPVTPGNLATVTGHLANDNGERAFVADTVVTTSGTAANIPGALFLTIRSVGGGNYFWNVSGESCGQQGITDAIGLNNIGLLVKIAGAFTWVSANEFIVDDGSGASIKCIVPNSVTLNSSWSNVSVTGISSCEGDGYVLHRLIRVRQQSDIVAY